MTDIEKLTDEQRQRLDRGEYRHADVGAALRIIEQLTEALATADGNHKLERADREHFEARVRELEAENTRLRRYGALVREYRWLVPIRLL